MNLVSLIKNLFSGSKEDLVVDAVVFGLGNPEAKYCNNRHNIGFLVADKLSGYLKDCREVAVADAMTKYGVLESGQRILIVKPLTYMNRSGIAVRNGLEKSGLPISKAIVIVDDYNIPFGKIRARRDGSHGGHNGLKSIIEYVGDGFPRLRIGIGPLPNKANIIDFVLGDFTEHEDKVLKNEILEKAASALKLFVTDGIDVVMNTYN
ncbi:MAG: aminoacyl-tRNA hydrolase [Fibrobacter sp.]|nr:aminoacyl-tRNA hydrolase [Fibrobacter sp.]